MLTRRYLFLEGQYKGTAKITPIIGSGAAQVDVTLDTAPIRDVRAYLTGEEGALNYLLGKILAGEGRRSLTVQVAESRLFGKQVDLQKCGCVVLPGDMGEKEEKKTIWQPRAAAFLPKEEEVHPLPTFESCFESNFGLVWRTHSFDDALPPHELLSAVLLNRGAISCVNRYGGFWIGEKDENISIIAIPARIGTDPFPCPAIFRSFSYIEERREKFGCWAIGMDQKQGVLFPAIFE